MKKSNHMAYIFQFIHPLLLLVNVVPGSASLQQSGTAFFLGYMIMGGSAKPLADTQVITVCVLPLCPEVRDQTIFQPASAITFPTL